jgi:hypothetical protein
MPVVAVAGVVVVVLFYDSKIMGLFATGSLSKNAGPTLIVLVNVNGHSVGQFCCALVAADDSMHTR